MKADPTSPLLAYFYHWENATPNAVFLRQPFGDQWKDFTWHEAGQQVRKIAAYLKTLQLPPHTHIGLVSKNCAEWVITDLAIMMAGHVSVPFFPNLTADQINLVLTHSGCKVLFVGKLDDWAGMKQGIPEGVVCISFPTYNPDPAHVQWADIQAHQPLADSPLPNIDDLMSIVYTSGTTGKPKGVMLSFRCISSVVADMYPHLKQDVQPKRFISYMPLCHIAERAVLESNAILSGATVYFVESLDTFAKNLAAARPTHFGSVPRIWVKFQQGILGKMPQRKLDIFLKIPILSTLVKRKIRTGLGLQDAQLIIVGAAPMPDSLTQWFRKLGLHLQNVYAMSENTAGATIMPLNAIKDGTVGKPLRSTQIKIEPETGEVCTKGPYTMMGYYNEPQMTAETIDSEGWLHTGDVGELDAQGYLKITGRLKEMYKTSKGFYVAPAQIEMGFVENAWIEQVCVVGEDLAQPIALVVLSDLGKAADRADVVNSLRDSRVTVNASLKPYEKIHKVVVMSEAWTVENNLMTPTLKLKRKEIEKRYRTAFADWYKNKEEVVWV